MRMLLPAGTAAGSNGRSMTDPPRSASSSAPGTPPYGSSTAQSPRPSTSGSAKAGALLQQLPSAPVYKFTIVSLPRACLPMMCFSNTST